jgi:Arc/MetJ family transcription regulator
MPTNLSIDDKLLVRAQKLGRKRTKKDTVNEALSEYIQRREQKKALSLFGTVDYYEDYDPKRYQR